MPTSGRVPRQHDWTVGVDLLAAPESPSWTAKRLRDCFITPVNLWIPRHFGAPTPVLKQPLRTGRKDAMRRRDMVIVSRTHPDGGNNVEWPEAHGRLTCGRIPLRGRHLTADAVPLYGDV